MATRAWADLATLLRTHGVDTEQWGTGAAKKVEDLAAEIESGECRLTCDMSGRIVRNIEVVGVDVYFCDERSGPLRLVETEQRFKSGQRRQRSLRTSLGEKQLPGEPPGKAARRAIAEELGLPPEDLELVETGAESTTGESGSYPGLRSCRRLTYFECTLPASLFESSGYEERQRDKTTHFAWSAAA